MSLLLSQQTPFEPREFDLAQGPDRVIRPTFAAALQLAFAAPALLILAPVAPDFYAPVFPNAVSRPAFHASQQQATATDTRAERVAPLAVVVYPDAIRRPWLATAEQLATVLPQRERTSPLAAPVYPDATRRPFYAVAAQQAAVLPQRERTAPIAAVVFPDAVLRPAFTAAAQGPAFVLPPRPEETLAQDWEASWPDAVTRPSLRVADQLAETASDAPERTSPLDGATFPEAVRRPRFATADQLAAVLPQVERTSPIEDVSYPAWVRRPLQLAAGQFVQPILPPAAPVVQVLDWSASYPDRLRTPPIAHGLSFVVDPTPVAPVAPTFFGAQYPDYVRGPSRAASGDGAAFVHRDATVAAGWETTYPDRLDRARACAPDVAGFVAPGEVLAPVPPLAWASEYPSAISRPHGTPTWFALVEPPPPPPTFFGALYPDRAPLPLRPAIGFVSFDPFPIPTPLAIDWPSLIAASRRDVTLAHAAPGDVTIRGAMSTHAIEQAATDTTIRVGPQR